MLAAKIATIHFVWKNSCWQTIAICVIEFGRKAKFRAINVIDPRGKQRNRITLDQQST